MPLSPASIWRTTARRTPWRCLTTRYSTSTTLDGDPTAGDPPWFTALRASMLAREPITMTEYLSYDVYTRLNNTLASVLPEEWTPRPVSWHDGTLPIGHHLVWFNPNVPIHRLLIDGTDPLHSPGYPWTRRMWAGGSLQAAIPKYFNKHVGFTLNNWVTCVEHIKDVKLIGRDDAAKIFVTIERRYVRPNLKNLDSLMTGEMKPIIGDGEFSIKFNDDDPWAHGVLKEQRTLVFLRERKPEEIQASTEGKFEKVKYVKSKFDNPTFSSVIVPNRPLLFRYSAMTFNQHLLHLDRRYVRKFEGHQQLLVHGPLILTLMLQAMSGFLKQSREGFVIESIDYKNFAPLYCNDSMRICGKLRQSWPNAETYDMWIEGPTGGMAVKARIRAALVDLQANPKQGRKLSRKTKPEQKVVFVKPGPNQKIVLLRPSKKRTISNQRTDRNQKRKSQSVDRPQSKEKSQSGGNPQSEETSQSDDKTQ